MEPTDERRPRKPPVNEHLLKFARGMRSHSTDAEKRLWRILRDRRLGGFKFRRQVPMGKYILHFHCHEENLVVEADGGQHSEPVILAKDLKRTEYLKSLGIRVLRFWDNDILKFTDAVREKIYRELTKENCSQATSIESAPHPNPLPEGEGAGGDSRFARGETVSSNRDAKHP
jgi:very-short-patch-repair endonuclease